MFGVVAEVWLSVEAEAARLLLEMCQVCVRQRRLLSCRQTKMAVTLDVTCHIQTESLPLDLLPIRYTA